MKKISIVLLFLMCFSNKYYSQTDVREASIQVLVADLAKSEKRLNQFIIKPDVALQKLDVREKYINAEIWIAAGNLDEYIREFEDWGKITRRSFNFRQNYLEQEANLKNQLDGYEEQRQRYEQLAKRADSLSNQADVTWYNDQINKLLPKIADVNLKLFELGSIPLSV